MSLAHAASNGEPDAPSVTAEEILVGPREKVAEVSRSFLAALKGNLILAAIEDDATFATILRFALENGLVRQIDLSSRLRYANSQVGRWAAGKAAPPYVVRERVIAVMRELVEHPPGGAPQH